MPDNLITTPATASVPAAAPTVPSGSQETTPAPQGDVSPQAVPSAPVEAAVQLPSSTPGTRVKPSEYVRQRMEMNNLRRQVADMQRMIETSQARTAPVPAQPQKPEVDYNKIVWDKPVDVMNELIQNALDSQIPKLLEQRLSAQRTESNRKEALELIFKNEHVSRDGDEGYERIVQIIKENGLDDLAKSRPIEAAKAALKIYKADHPGISVPPKSATPLAPKAGQMASTQTGNAAPSVNKENNVNEIQEKLKQLRQEIILNPEKAMSEEFKAQVSGYAKQLQEMSQKTQ